MNLPGISRIYHGGSASGGSGYSGSGAAPAITPFITYGNSEAESTTVDMAFVNKLTVSFVATLGVRYKIDYYCEVFSAADEDVEAQVTINTVECSFAHFKNAPYADRWAQFNGGFCFHDNLNGAVDVEINFRSGYGAGDKKIRRARILITRVD